MTVQTPTGGFPWSGVTSAGTSVGGTKSAQHHTKFGSVSGYSSIVADMNVTQTIKAEWVNAYNQLVVPGPTRAYFKISVSALTDALRTGAYHTTADDGMGDVGLDNGSGVESAGSHLVQRDGTSGTILFTQTFVAHYDSQSPGCLYADIDWFFDVVPDTRAITLSREGAHGETIDSDGTVHGDTRFSYSAYSALSDGGYTSYYFPNWQVFHPNYIGTWHWRSGYDYMGHPATVPDASWGWNPCATNKPQAWDVCWWSMLDGSMNLWDGSWEGTIDHPEARTMTYVAQDNVDGVQATAKYVLTMHDLYEANYEDCVRSHVVENLRTPNYAVYGSNPAGASGPTSITVGVSQTYTWNLSVQFSGTTGRWIAAVLGINVIAQYGQSLSASVTVTAPSVPPGFMTCIQVFDVYNYHNGVLDQWDAGGKTGTPAYEVKVPDNPAWGVTYKYPYLPIGQ